jgi:ring-1,2-phenylacetyl-CoA epoxidase subunit PaaC
MDKNEALLTYVFRLADNALVISQRLIEIVTRGPELEEEMANANFSLDYLGQARLFYSLAGELEGQGRTEDDFAYLRDEQEFCNFLLNEQPNGHFGDTIARSVLFDEFYQLQLDALVKCSDDRLASIAVRAAREIRYHRRHNTQWLIRLGDGTSESHVKAQEAIDRLWSFTGEMFDGDKVDDLIRDAFAGPNLASIRDTWLARVTVTLEEATLDVPEDQWMDRGGRIGRHTEHFGPMIAEMQYLQRSYPGLTW